MALSHRQPKTKRSPRRNSACVRVGTVKACLSATRKVMTGFALADFASCAVKSCVGFMALAQFTGTKTLHCASVLGLFCETTSVFPAVQHQLEKVNDEDFAPHIIVDIDALVAKAGNMTQADPN